MLLSPLLPACSPSPLAVKRLLKKPPRTPRPLKRLRKKALTPLLLAALPPLLVLTPKKDAARRMGLLWGAHAVTTRDIVSFEEMIAKGKRMALRHGIGAAGAKLVMMAGVPFGTPGSTNVLHVATLTGDELRGYS